MTILTTLQDEMKNAMKSRDQARLDALRLMVSSIKYAQVDLPRGKAGSPNITDEQIVPVLQKEAKKRREAIEAYKAAGRGELQAKEEYELKLIEDYLPKMMSEDEVRAKVQAALESAKPENFGMAMNVAMKAVAGQSSGVVVSKVVKELFGK